MKIEYIAISLAAMVTVCVVWCIKANNYIGEFEILQQ